MYKFEIITSKYLDSIFMMLQKFYLLRSSMAGSRPGHRPQRWRSRWGRGPITHMCNTNGTSGRG